MRIYRPTLLMGCLILAASVCILIYARTTRADHAPWSPLAHRLPMTIGPWQGEDLPLGETERVLEAVDRLNYTDYVYRRYTRGGESVYVYAMFWRQGDISIREMAGHTPDGCWVANGATRVGDKGVVSLSLSGGKTKNAELRVFDFNRQGAVRVAWWHLWGGEIVPSTFGRKSVRVMVDEIWRWLVTQRGRSADQIFIRIHGPSTGGEFESMAPVQRFLEEFPDIWEQ